MLLRRLEMVPNQAEQGAQLNRVSETFIVIIRSRRVVTRSRRRNMIRIKLRNDVHMWPTWSGMLLHCGINCFMAFYIPLVIITIPTYPATVPLAGKKKRLAVCNSLFHYHQFIVFLSTAHSVTVFIRVAKFILTKGALGGGFCLCYEVTNCEEIKRRLKQTVTILDCAG